MKQHYTPSGELQGDDREIPYKGTETGMSPAGHEAIGKSLARDATNSMGSAHSSSDPAERSMPAQAPMGRA